MKHEILMMGALALLLPCLSLTSCRKEHTASSKPAMLVVSFGTSYPESREKTIGVIESDLAKAYPQYELRRAFTSKIIIDKLKKRDGLVIDTVDEALSRLEKSGVKDLIIQPTLVMNGIEYDEVLSGARPYTGKFKTIHYGAPLLSSDRDFDEFVDAITGDTAPYDDGDTAVVFMGHGTEHDANTVYARLNTILKAKGFSRYFVGTVEAEPSLEDALEAVSKLGVHKVTLLPLMIVAGDHAANDMAGDEDDSWKSVFEAHGYSVTPILKGLGEYPGVRRIFIRHFKEAIS